MISRRLTKTQKAEILEAYRAGESTNDLANQYSCSQNTINRTVKTLLSEDEYANLKEERLKINNKKGELINKNNLNERPTDLEIKLERKNSMNSEELISEELDNPLKIESLALEDANDFEDETSSDYSNNEIDLVDKINKEFDDNFEVIAPLASSFNFELEKEKSEFQIENAEILPEIVYMLVDKKVELDSFSISDLPEWNFLPQDELKRNAILLFSNQRAAKRSCSRNQRVIKVPNTSVFTLSKSYLLSKGITRLILEESIIALDN